MRIAFAVCLAANLNTHTHVRVCERHVAAVAYAVARVHVRLFRVSLFAFQVYSIYMRVIFHDARKGVDTLCVNVIFFYNYGEFTIRMAFRYTFRIHKHIHIQLVVYIRAQNTLSFTWQGGSPMHTSDPTCWVPDWKITCVWRWELEHIRNVLNISKATVLLRHNKIELYLYSLFTRLCCFLRLSYYFNFEPLIILLLLFLQYNHMHSPNCLLFSSSIWLFLPEFSREASAKRLTFSMDRVRKSCDARYIGYAGELKITEYHRIKSKEVWA